ncbi:MAG: RraA family protein [Oscillospiraceae bacterium]|nr:RraA family protein [Oscillospiraceae bacterium]
MKLNCREDIIQMTPLWTGERFPDGRPKVPDDILARIKKTTIEEMWAPLVRLGYNYQHETGLKRTNPNVPTVVGRAVTAHYLPTRPDLANYLLKYGHEEEGRKGFFNQWPLEDLQKDDFMVIDMYGKVRNGCAWGGNLTTLIYTKTGVGGLTSGGVRDLEQIVGIEGSQFYYKGYDPTPFRDAMLVGINVPVKIGEAVCMPGDVVLGTEAGIIFVPAHLAETCVIDAEKTHVRDIFGFQRLHEGKYTAAQIDTAWERIMWEDFAEWFPVAPEAEPYRHLDFTQELEDARNGIIPGRPRPQGQQESTRW